MRHATSFFFFESQSDDVLRSKGCGRGVQSEIPEMEESFGLESKSFVQRTRSNKSHQWRTVMLSLFSALSLWFSLSTLALHCALCPVRAASAL
jgi:hypothetical protein